MLARDWCMHVCARDHLVIDIVNMHQVIGLVTAGGFLYVALVTVLPSLLDDSSFAQSLGEVVAIATGVALMACVSIFE
jgi:hypothetical protein